MALAGVLAVLSLDEASALHERLGGPTEALLGDAAGRFAWVVPGAVLVAVVGAFFLPFLLRLPAPVRRRVLGGGTAFVLGAVVVETISGVVLEAQGDRAAYLLVTAAEEGLEMTGAIWLLCAALSCLTVTTDTAGSYRLTLLDDLRRSSGHHPARSLPLRRRPGRPQPLTGRAGPSDTFPGRLSGGRQV